MVRTSVYDLLRSERRRGCGNKRWLPQIEPAADDVEHIAWLEEKLRAVDPKIAELIELRFAHGWTLARIADRLGLTTAAVDGRFGEPCIRSGMLPGRNGMIDQIRSIGIIRSGRRRREEILQGRTSCRVASPKPHPTDPCRRSRGSRAIRVIPGHETWTG